MIKMLKNALIAGAMASCIIASMSSIHAQNPTKLKKFTLEDIISGGSNFYQDFYPSSLWKLGLFNNGKYLYLSNQGKKGLTLIQGEARGTTYSESELISYDEIRKIIGKKHLDGLDYLPNLNAMEIYADNKVIVYNFINKKILSTKDNCPQKSQDFTLSPNGERIAFTKDNNIYVAEMQPSSDNIQLSTDGSETIVYGQTVHQSEFGINGGVFWSPKSHKMAFYRMDQSMVSPYPIVDAMARKAEERPQRYPMAGMKSHQVTVGVYDFNTKRTIYLKTGLPKEKYLTNISWSPDESTIYICEVNRKQDTLNLVAYDALTGDKKKVLFTETDANYVEPVHHLVFVPGKNNEFIYQTRKDGFNALYLYNTDGKLIRRYMHPNADITNFLGFDPSGKMLYYVAATELGMSRKLYSVSTKGGKPKCLTPQDGVHHIMMNPDKTYYIDNFQNHTTPRIISLVNTKTNKGAEIHIAKNPSQSFEIPTIKVGTIMAADGKTPLNYRLILPPNLDPNKKYPTIVYVYGGPHAQLVTNTWLYDARGWDIYMAQHGYIMFTLDNRGSTDRGKEFEQVIHRHLGKNEMADQIKGVEYLKSLPYVDGNRLGVHGWSFGGFMTTNLMLTYPDTFKVGVAGGPVMDWSRYEIMYGERYMDTPQENPDGYRDANLPLRAKNLQGRLLIIHGYIDNVVLLQHSLLFLRSCVQERTYPDFLLYPTHQHNVIGQDRVHLYKKVTQYFEDHL